METDIEELDKCVSSQRLGKKKVARCWVLSIETNVKECEKSTTRD